MEESDSETKVKTPPRRRNKSQREKREEKKKKQQAVDRTDQPAAARTATTSMWREGDAFKPEMNSDDMPGNHKQAFIQAQPEFTRSGTTEAKAYKIDSLEKMLREATYE